MTRAAGIVGAAIALAAAVVLLLLALDVHRWPQRIAADDSAFAVRPSRPDLWKPTQTTPFGAARKLLSLDDDRAYRNALDLFALGRPWYNGELVPVSALRYRKLALIALDRAVQRDHDLERKSRELNMVGALSTVTVTPYDAAHRLTGLLHAAVAYNAAVLADGGDDAAKFNLEVTLRLITRFGNAQLTLHGLGGAVTGESGSGMGY